MSGALRGKRALMLLLGRRHRTEAIWRFLIWSAAAAFMRWSHRILMGFISRRVQILIL
jgi:hypothetical protein